VTPATRLGGVLQSLPAVRRPSIAAKPFIVFFDVCGGAAFSRASAGGSEVRVQSVHGVRVIQPGKELTHAPIIKQLFSYAVNGIVA